MTTDWKENLAQRITDGFRASSVPALTDHQAQTILDEIGNGSSLDEAADAVSAEYVRHAISVQKANSITTRLLHDSFNVTEEDDIALHGLVRDRLRHDVPDSHLIYIAALKTAVLVAVPVSSNEEDDDIPEFVFETNFKTILDTLIDVKSLVAPGWRVELHGACLKVRNDLLVRTEVAHDLYSFAPRIVSPDEHARIDYLAAEIPGKAVLALGSMTVHGATR